MKTQPKIDLSTLEIAEIQKIVDELTQKNATLSNHFSEIERATNSGIFEFDFENKVLLWSDNCYKIFGVSKTTEISQLEILKRKLGNEDIIKISQEITNSFEKGIPFDVTYSWVKDDGTVCYINTIGNTYIEKVSGKKKIIGTNKNVTEQKIIENELKISEDKFRLAFGTSPDPIAITRISDGMFLEVNQIFEKVTGYAYEDIVGKTSFEMNVWVDLKDRDKFFDEISSKGFCLNFETKLRQKNGRIVVGLVSAAVIMIDSERCILSTTRDITDRKRGEVLTLFQRDKNEVLLRAEKISDSSNLIFSYAKQKFDIESCGLIVFSDEESKIFSDSIGFSKTLINYFSTKQFELQLKKEIDFSNNNVCDDTRVIRSILKTKFKQEFQSTLFSTIKLENKVAALLIFGKSDFEFCSEENKKWIELFVLNAGSFVARLFTELKFKESNNKLQKFFETDIAGHYECNSKGQIIDCNSEFVRLLGASSKKEILFTSLQNYQPKKSNFELLVKELNKNSLLKMVETRLISKTGSEVLVLENILGRFNDNGKLIGFSGYVNDITQLKLSEKALVESERNYRELFTRMANGFLLLEVIKRKKGKPFDCKVISINQSLEKFFNVTSEQIVGKTLLQIEPNLSKEILSIYKKVARTNKPARLNYYSKGSGRHVQVLAYTPSKNKIAVIIENVTELKKSEEKIKQLSIAVEQNPVIIMITDVNGIIEYVNPKFTMVSGYSFDEVIGNTPGFLKSGYTTKEQYENLWKQLRAGKDWVGRFKNKKKNGEFFWESTIISPLKNEKGKITHFVAIKEDITQKIEQENKLLEYQYFLEQKVEERTHELRVMNTKLNEQIDKLSGTEQLLKVSLSNEKELNELKTRFITTASHEFRTPLTSILSSTELLMKYGKNWPEEKFAEHLLRTKRSAESLVKLLDDVLTISRTENGKQLFLPALCDLKQFCRDILAEAIPTSKETHKFIYNFNLKKKEYPIDSKLVKFILLNLLTNAVKYSPDGGDIKLIVSGDKKNIYYSISDQGIGIPDEEKPYIFENFHRSKITENIAGTGLGLAIVKKSVELHKGQISFISKLNVGTTFLVTLPKDYPLNYL